MEADKKIPNNKKVEICRNRDCFLLGGSWSHYKGWDFRTTHIYLGLWVLTIRTKSAKLKELFNIKEK